jgi:hypothetical protein
LLPYFQEQPNQPRKQQRFTISLFSFHLNIYLFSTFVDFFMLQGAGDFSPYSTSRSSQTNRENSA